MPVREQYEKRGENMSDATPTIITEMALCGNERGEPNIYVIDLQNQHGIKLRIGITIGQMLDLREAIEDVIRKYPDLRRED